VNVPSVGAADPDQLVEEVEDLLARLPSGVAWAKVVIDARFNDPSTLSLYGLGGLSKRFAGWIVRPLAGIGLGVAPEELELGEWAIGVSLLRVFVERRFLWAARGRVSEYVGAADEACRDAERAVGALAQLGAELHVGIELAVGGFLKYLPQILLKRRLDRACGGREGHGAADYRRRGRLYVFLSHSCALHLPHALKSLGLCKF